MSRLKHVQVSRLEKRSKEKCWKKTEWKLPLAPAAQGAHGWRSLSRGGGHKPIGAGRRMGRRRKLPWTATEIQWWLLQMFVLIWNCHSCVFLKLFQLKNGVVIVNYRNIVAFTWQAFGFANAKALHQHSSLHSEVVESSPLYWLFLMVCFPSYELQEGLTF